MAVVKHLLVLDRAGLVESRRAGREVRYGVRTERGWRRRPAGSPASPPQWDDRLAALKRLAEEG